MIRLGIARAYRLDEIAEMGVVKWSLDTEKGPMNELFGPPVDIGVSLLDGMGFILGDAPLLHELLPSIVAVK